MENKLWNWRVGKVSGDVYLKPKSSSGEGILPSLISLISNFSVILLHACPDISDTTVFKPEKFLGSQEEGDPENNLQGVSWEQEIGVKGHICRSNSFTGT